MSYLLFFVVVTKVIQVMVKLSFSYQNPRHEPVSPVSFINNDKLVTENGLCHAVTYDSTFSVSVLIELQNRAGMYDTG